MHLPMAMDVLASKLKAAIICSCDIIATHGTNILCLCDPLVIFDYKVWSMAVCDYCAFFMLENLVSLAHVVSTAKEER